MWASSKEVRERFRAETVAVCSDCGSADGHRYGCRYWDEQELVEWEQDHRRFYGDRPATESEAHAEWHRNSGVPMGTPGCPQDGCHVDDQHDY